MDLPSSADDSEDGEGIEDGSGNWGRSKKVFYSADGTVEDLDDEAQEARKLQKRKLSGIKEEDYFYTHQKDHATAKKTASGPLVLELSDGDASEVEAGASSEGEEKYCSEAELVALDGEKLEALLPKRIKKMLVERHSQETQQFLGEFRQKIREIKETIEPQIAKLKLMKTSKGLAFLETKYQIFVGYCANLAYYMLLCVRGKSLEQHPVIERLLKYRLLIEKIKPMEIKLQYQVEKLLRAEKTDATRMDQDEKALAFRPNIASLEAGAEEGDEGQGEEETGDGLYKVAKVAPVHFQDKKLAVSAKEREKSASSRSRMLADVQADVEDRPEEDVLDPVYGASRVRAPSKRRDNYEEDNFVRFTLSKKEQRKLEQLEGKPVDELEDLNDFFRDTDNASTRTATGRKSVVQKLLGNKTPKAKKASGDEDSSAQRAKASKKTPAAREHEDEEIDSEMSEVEDDIGEHEFYKSVKAKHSEAKQRRSGPAPPRKPVSYRPLRDVGPEHSRKASYEMMKNRGLTPHRPKEVRNPRVRQRNKWERAQKKIKSFKTVASTPARAYSGESSGIRTNVSRSAKF